MTLTQLLNFVKIAELGSFTKAAAIVRIAQPALSRQMRHLEAELSIELFVRHGWGVTLTEAGEVLREHAGQILREVERAKDAVAALAVEPTGRITIGVPATLATILLPPLAVALRAKYPRLRPRFIDDFSAGLHNRVLEGELDLALLYAERSIDALLTRPALTERLMLVFAPGREHTFDEILRNEPVVLSAPPSRLREIIDNFLAVHDDGKVKIVEADSLPAIVGMVARGGGCTILPYSTVASEVERGELAILALPYPDASRKLLLAQSLDRPPSAASQAVDAELRSIILDLTPRFGWAPA